MRSSQNHKRDVHGQSSDYQFAGRLKSLTQHGTNTVPAKIEVRGVWPLDAVATAVVNIGGADLTDNYTVTGDPTETSDEVATGLAALINAQADVTATATGSIINVTKSTAGSVSVVSVSVA